jgi:NAD(P)H-dependent FMN reductase
MNIAVISGSTRNVRRSHRVALAVVKQIKSLGHQASIIDLIENIGGYNVCCE